MTRFEFWPDYGHGPLWTEDGNPVEPADLGLPASLCDELRDWNRRYADDKLPGDGPGDLDWLREGRELLQRTRHALAPSCEVVVTETWWGEPPVS